jgi:hypothetical protein
MRSHAAEAVIHVEFLEVKRILSASYILIVVELCTAEYRFVSGVPWSAVTSGRSCIDKSVCNSCPSAVCSRSYVEEVE